MQSDKEPASQNGIAIVPSSAHYADQMEQLTGIVYDLNPREDDSCFNADHFRAHLNVFPEGQFIAINTKTDTVVGLTVCMRTHFNPDRPTLEPWWHVIGYGWLTTHVPDGDWLYGVESCVHPAYQGKGIGGRLMDARFKVLQQLNLRGMVAGSAIIDYPKVADSVTVEQYVQDVIAGQRFDTNLTKQLHKGFHVAHLLPGYLSVEETGGWGVEIVWENTSYEPHTAEAIESVSQLSISQ